jgi:septal ring factor EnvC (AmiA/AmiB activator)
MHIRRIGIRLIPAAIGAVVLGAAALAQPAGDSTSTAEREARLEELAALTRDIVLTEERQAAIRRDIEALERDRARLNQALIDTGARARELEGRIDRTEWRLQSLIAGEISLRDDLAERRAVFAEVLGALQRIGRKPPPAIVVRAEDALTSVRSAMLLSAVVPDLERRAALLADDLTTLVALRQEIEDQYEQLRTDASQLAIEETRINILISKKGEAEHVSRQALDASEARAAALAGEATSLKELIARMETEIEAVVTVAREAEQAEVASLGPSRPERRSLGAADRIAPAVPFADAREMLPFPANGVVVRQFGEDDGIGGTAQGISIATRSGARVSTPADGWVVYAGPFRSYGELLIINASGGYHIVLAGMERIDVELGQFVLAGEPVAVMGEQRLASAGAVDIGASQPMLYVEFRKDGASVDPSPWWARSSGEKVDG